MNETNSITSTNVVGNVVDSIKDSDSLLEGLLTYFTTLDSVHYITFVINLLIFIFGRQIINNLSVQTIGANQSRLRLLRLINTILFLTYLVAVAFQLQLASNFSHTGLLMLLTYLGSQFAHSLILKRYGRQGSRRHLVVYRVSHLAQPTSARPAASWCGRRPDFPQHLESRKLAANNQLPWRDCRARFHDKAIG